MSSSCFDITSLRKTSSSNRRVDRGSFAVFGRAFEEPNTRHTFIYLFVFCRLTRFNLSNSNSFSSTHRPDTLDPALLRPGRLDRRVEFGLPDNEGRAHILRIHARSMSVERDIRFDLIARLCPNTTGAELKSVATEAGMFAIRARRKMATEKDFLEAVDKVVRQGSKFSSTSLYAQVSILT